MLAFFTPVGGIAQYRIDLCCAYANLAWI